MIKRNTFTGLYIHICRAGHATTLPRHRDHVFKTLNSWLLLFYFIRCATSFRHRDLNTFRIFLVSEVLFRCRDVVVAKLKKCRVPSSAYLYWKCLYNWYGGILCVGWAWARLLPQLLLLWTLLPLLGKKVFVGNLH